MPDPHLPLSIFSQYDLTLLAPFLCPSCGGVLHHPVSSACEEEHSLCLACYQPGKACAQCVKEGKDDRGGGVGGKAMKALERAVGELEVKCRHSCGWEGKVASLEAHDQQCPSRPFSRPCPNSSRGCTLSFSSPAALKEHKLDPQIGCEWQKIACMRAGFDEERGKARCILLRGEREEHEQVCEWHRCPTPSCPTRGTLSFLSTHTAHCSSIHSLASKVETYASRNDSLVDKVSDLEDRCIALQETLEELEGDLLDKDDVEADLLVQIATLESATRGKEVKLAKVQKLLDETRATSCAKDTKIMSLETSLEKEEERRSEVDEMLEEMEDERDELEMQCEVLTAEVVGLKAKAAAERAKREKEKREKEEKEREERKKKIEIKKEEKDKTPMAAQIAAAALNTSGPTSATSIASPSNSSSSAAGSAESSSPVRPVAQLSKKRLHESSSSSSSGSNGTGGSRQGQAVEGLAKKTSDVDADDQTEGSKRRKRWTPDEL
ncbi:hypothetical protein JCM11251_003109 [Rhodosporidiobolus azoricus]